MEEYTLILICLWDTFISASTFAQDDVVVIEHPDLQDGSTKPWPPEVVSSHVRDFVKKTGVKTVRSRTVCAFHATWKISPKNLRALVTRCTGEMESGSIMVYFV